MQEEAEAAGEALAALDTTDIYQGLAMAREQANSFVSVLSKLGDGEGRLTNLHDAVMETARAMAGELGITDDAAIVKIGEELLEGLYDTYPGIADYVDTATGMLLDGWKEGIAEATNPWAELFEAAKLEDALKAAKRDMAALEDSSLWAELLAPGGKGLYQYAGDWARELIPDGTRGSHRRRRRRSSRRFSPCLPISTRASWTRTDASPRAWKALSPLCGRRRTTCRPKPPNWRRPISPCTRTPSRASKPSGDLRI